MNVENEIILRRGPSSQDYLLDFVNFLHRKTGFRLENFRSSELLNKLCDTLEYYEVPRQIWNALMNVAVRMIAAVVTEEISVEIFISILTPLLFELWMWFASFFIIYAVKIILKYIGSTPVAERIIDDLYKWATFAAEHFWQRYIKTSMTDEMKRILTKNTKYLL